MTSIQSFCRRCFKLAAGFVIALSSLSAINARADTVKISASRSAKESIFDKIKDTFEKESGLHLEIISSEHPDIVGYFKDVVDGKSEAAVASQAYDVWMKVVGEAKVPIPAEMTQRVISRDIMVIVANADTKIGKLSQDQIEAVFTGNVKSWKEVGGSDIPIVIITYRTKQGKGPAFSKLAMHDKPFAKAAREVAGEESDIAKAVAAAPGAASFITSKVPMTGLTAVETPPLGRPVTLITKGQPSPGIQKLIQFIRANGAKFGIK